MKKLLMLRICFLGLLFYTASPEGKTAKDVWIYKLHLRGYLKLMLPLKKQAMNQEAIFIAHVTMLCSFSASFAWRNSMLLMTKCCSIESKRTLPEVEMHWFRDCEEMVLSLKRKNALITSFLGREREEDMITSGTSITCSGLRPGQVRDGWALSAALECSFTKDQKSPSFLDENTCLPWTDQWPACSLPNHFKTLEP